MRERKLIPGNLFDYHEIKQILKDISPGKTTYYKAILQNLFFATLNTKERKYRFQITGWKNISYMDHSVYRYQNYFINSAEALEIFKDIPFLNGGLFDCLDRRINVNKNNVEIRIDGFSDKEVGLKFPNFLFFSEETNADLKKDFGTKNKNYKVQGLINILSAYNFTIDENEPNDQEVALDPELLGKVFENLLASFNPETSSTARKATGSYYTPREIVDYMVTRSIKEYLKTHLKDVEELDKKLDDLFATGNENNPFTEQGTKNIVKLIDVLRIVDPAVGSGAFPMGILNKLVFILSKLDPGNSLWKETQINAVAQNVPDPVIKQDLINQIEIKFREKNPDYGRKLYLIQKCIYGVDIQQIAVEIAKLRFFISLLVDEKIDKEKENWGIEALPNLDFKIMQGNSLVSEFMGINFDEDENKNNGVLSFEDETYQLIQIFQEKKNEFQNESDKHKKDKLTKEIEDLIIQIFETKLQKQKANYFSQLNSIENKYSTLPNEEQRNEMIAKEKHELYKMTGFNLEEVEKKLREFTSGNKTKPFFLWKLYFAEVFQGDNPGFDIVIGNPPYKIVKKSNTNLNLLNLYKKYYSADFKINLFSLFVEKSIILGLSKSLITLIIPDTSINLPAFKKLREFILNESSLINISYYNVDVFQKSSVGKSIILFLKNDSIKDSFIFREFQTIFDYKDNNVSYHQVINDDDKKFIYSYSGNFEELLFNRIKSIKTKLVDYCDIYDGINPGSEFTKNMFISKLYKDNYSNKIIDGKNFNKYSPIIWDGSYIFYNENYVEKIRNELKEKNIPFNARIIKKARFFEKDKIVSRQTAETIIATKDTEHYYVKNSIHSTLIKMEFKTKLHLNFVLSVLNSKLIDWFYRKESLEKGRLFPQVKINRLRSLPFIYRDNLFQQTFIKFIDRILNITKAEDYLENPEKQARVKQLEKEIDKLVYELYVLTEEEIRVVEGN